MYSSESQVITNEKRGVGAPRKGKNVRVRVTRSFSPELLTALDQVTTNQSEFIEQWMWKHPLVEQWLAQQSEGSCPH